MNITRHTKKESYIAIQHQIGNRQKQCLEALDIMKEATANELAMYLKKVGELPYFSRNFVQPRLNELVERKAVKIVGKKKCPVTGRTCAVYKVNSRMVMYEVTWRKENLR